MISTDTMILSPVINIIETLWLAILVPILFLYGPSFLQLLLTAVLSQRCKSDKTKLRQQIAEYRKELSQISQVNEFAKYSKLERRLRAANDQLSTINRKDLELSVAIGIVIHIIVKGISFILAIYGLYGLSQKIFT